MSTHLTEIHARLRAADRALALAHGGSSELAHVRQAAGSLLVALHQLVELWEEHLLAPGGLSADSAALEPRRRVRK